MIGQRRTNRESLGTTMHNAVTSVLFGRTDATTIEECRRCGNAAAPTETACPVCGCDDIVTYRIG
ncbi:hypothetical protein [Halopiger djelfimassiliensis]|uniref:hypothetical protein n=1 Tax=Halopiger djelfimassiliensis TaxID=1293047 RepID=UPI000677DDBA|nr:hypothetical protein [Halopiger djelfimassiliensis]